MKEERRIKRTETGAQKEIAEKTQLIIRKMCPL